MITQQHLARGSIPFRIAVSDTAVFDVLSTDEQLQQCRTFLRGNSSSGTDWIRIGEFGPFEVAVTRGADQWSVQIVIRAASDGGLRSDQIISANLSRADVLKALDEALSPQAAPQAPAPRQPLVPADLITDSRPRDASAGSSRNKRVLHTAADISKLAMHVATRWKVPRIVISIDALAELDRQRTQSRITRLAEVRAYQYGGPVAAAAVLLFGAANLVVMTMKIDELPMTGEQTRHQVMMLVVAVGCAWLIGKGLGALWCRLRLLLVLQRLRRRVRSLERGTSGATA